MGRALVRAASETPNVLLAVAIERPEFPHLGADAAQLAGLPPAGMPLTSDLPARGAADVWVDFSVPAATVATVRAAAGRGAAMVVGTTGLSPTDKEMIAKEAESIPVVLASNMSVGINAMLHLVADAARILGSAYDLEIVETHHRAKRDAPSGTALALAEALAQATGRDLAKSARYARQGNIGPRTDAEIGIQALRGGDVVGDHTVFFLGRGDRIEITHRASSRDTFAEGAMRAALWLPGRPAGLYDMRDVLGL